MLIQDRQQDVYRGYNVYVVIERNNDSCPLRIPTYDGSLQLPDENLVNMNGITYVNPSYHNPFTSFDIFISSIVDFSGYIFNTYTGEGRYYDGTQDDDADDFNTIMERAIGKTQSIGMKITRNVIAEPEMSEMYPSHLKSGTYDTTVNLEKLFIDKRRLDQTDISENVYNQFGFMGTSLIEVDELVTALEQDYHLVIFYIKDIGGDPTKHARSIVMPCVKFNTFNVQSATKTFISCDLSGKATYFESIPNDNLNVPTYTPYEGNVNPDPPPQCNLFLTVTDVGEGWIVGAGDEGDDEYWAGQTFEVTQSREICQADVYIYGIIEDEDGNLPDLQAKIYEVTAGVPGAEVGSSEIIAAGSITPGAWLSFSFDTHVNLATGEFAVTFESVNASPTDNMYIYRTNDLNPYGDGTLITTTNAVWGDLSNHWSIDSDSDLWCKLYSVI